MADVTFYLPTDRPYGALSNYFPRAITLDGLAYASSEHAFQAAKARDPAVRAWIMAAPTAILAAAAGDALGETDTVPDWAQAMVPLMRTILRAKFAQHADLGALLLGTGQARLVEVAPQDNSVNRYWSEVNGAGQNILGKLLMEIRGELEACAPRASSDTSRSARKQKRAGYIQRASRRDRR